jgi:succinoglycan biosynthesis protein ExoA
MNSAVPHISIVMPCYNEEESIGKSIETLVDEYFEKNCELIVVNGMSNDGTNKVVQSLINQGLQIKFLKNKKKLQTYGLNLGISEAKGEIIVRADAHSLYPPRYVKKCVELLKKTGASNVGGVMLPQGKKIVQKAIALALQHPAGVGNAKFHLGNYSGYVDTVYLGTYWKRLFDEIGLYDTNCETNEDAEFNIRILKSNKKVYLDSSIKVIYFPRSSLKDLAVQYFKYGRGRCYTTLKHRKITSARQLAPVILIIILLTSFILSFWNPLFLLIPLSYLVALFLIALLSWTNQNIPLKQRILTGVAWAIMHVSWGVGFLSHLIFRKNSA